MKNRSLPLLEQNTKKITRKVSPHSTLKTIPLNYEEFRLHTWNGSMVARCLAKSRRTGVQCGASINGILLLHFTIDAQQLFNQWYVKNEELLRESAFTTSEHSHFAKYRSLIPGLALLFHLLDGHSGAVCLNCTTSALQFSLYLKSHARRIYGSVHGQDYAPVRALAEKLLIGSLNNGFTQRALLHKGWANLSTPGQVQIAVDALVEYGWLFEHLSENVGRKTTLYYINKKISAELL